MKWVKEVHSIITRAFYQSPGVHVYTCAQRYCKIVDRESCYLMLQCSICNRAHENIAELEIKSSLTQIFSEGSPELRTQDSESAILISLQLLLHLSSPGKQHYDSDNTKMIKKEGAWRVEDKMHNISIANVDDGQEGQPKCRKS